MARKNSFTFIDESKIKSAIDAPLSAPSAWSGNDYWGEALTRGRKPTTAADAIRSFTSWIYIFASFNAAAVASVPLKLYAQKGSKTEKFKGVETKPITKRQMDWLSSNANIEPYLKKAAEVEEIVDHPFIDLMSKPNRYVTAMVIKETTCLFTDLTGEAYWYLASDNFGVPREIWVIPTQYMTPIYGETIDEFVTGYEFKRGGTTLILPIEDVIHFSYPNPKHEYSGFGCVAGICDAAYLNIKMYEYEEAVFENKARTGGVLESIEGISTPELNRLRLEFKQKYGGASRGGETVILPPGMKFNRDAMTPEELNFLGGKRQIREEMSAGFDIPFAVFDQTANRATAEAAGYQHAKHGILPRCKRQEQVINQFLLPKYGNKEGIIFCAYEDPVPENRELVLEENKTYVDVILTKDEIRQKLGEEPVEGGDKLYVENRMTPIGEEMIPPPEEPGKPEEPEEPEKPTEEETEKTAEKLARKTREKLKELLG